MTRTRSTWVAAAILGFGALMTLGFVRPQRSLELRRPLSAVVPTRLEGRAGSDVPISDAEQRIAGMTTYVLRIYGEGESAFSVYVGYYDRQEQGKTIHSPKNCLPGGGWEPLVQKREEIATAAGTVPVNRYLIGNGSARALVLYWYQGRGRVAANEYRVKWDLLRDQALLGRSDEALVRVVVPVQNDDEDAAYARAVRVARTLVPSVYTALPSA